MLILVIKPNETKESNCSNSHRKLKIKNALKQLIIALKYELYYIARYMQTSFVPKKDLRHVKAYSLGGDSLKKRRKIKRPLIPGLVTHVVFKSSKAKADLSFYKHKNLVAKLLKEKSHKFFIEVLDWVNMGNHIHCKVRFKDKKRMGQFLKSFAATLARAITGARKGKKFGKFWDGLVYTRVLTSKLEELGLKGYFEANHKEREYGYAEREMYLKRFNHWLYRLKRTKANSKSDEDKRIRTSKTELSKLR